MVVQTILFTTNDRAAPGKPPVAGFARLPGLIERVTYKISVLDPLFFLKDIFAGVDNPGGGSLRLRNSDSRWSSGASGRRFVLHSALFPVAGSQ